MYSAERENFIKQYMHHNGGSANNALRVWLVETLDRLKRDLSKPFPTDSELKKMGILID